MAASPEARAAALPQSYFREAAGQVRRNLLPREIVGMLRDGTEGGFLWVDVDSTNRHQLAVLEKVFNFHPLAIEDTLNPNSRVKLEEYPGYLFLIVRGVRFCDDTEDPYDTETFNLCFFLGKNYLVTVHGEHAPAVSALAERLARSPEHLERGAAWLMHAITDASVDAFFPIMDQIEEFANGLEERVFAKFDETALHEIFSVKRLVLQLRRHLAPQREVFNILTNRPTSLLTQEQQIYFRDVYDHVLRINESLDSYRELLSSTLDSYLSQVSNRLGQVTKALSVFATLSLPFVVVSGMWGMNFDSIPLVRHPYGFWIMLVLQLGIGFGLIGLLRWKKLI
jgi:magnesium transporter